MLHKGTTHPAFYNDRVIIDSLKSNYGVSNRDAVNYIHATCAEMSIAGKSKSHSTPFMINMPAILLDIVNNGRDFESFGTLIEHYVKAMHDDALIQCRDYLIRMLEGARIGNDAGRAFALIDNCIERGLSVYEGGEKYTMIQPIFIGFANAVDSLLAIKELVYNEKRVSLSEFYNIVEKEVAYENI